MQRITLRCTYRARGYTGEEMERLRSDLGGVVELQTRPQGIPEAGGMSEMIVIAQYLGKLAIDAVVLKTLLCIGKAFVNLYKEKVAASEGGFPPEIEVFELRFADVDLRLHGNDVANMECNFLSEITFQYLPEIVTAIKEHLDSEPLVSTHKMVIDAFEPDVCFSESGEPSFHFRHPWRITGIDVMAPPAYFPEERRLSDDHVRID
jgi:hypothetical protein